jgi:hypothetical protein
MKKLIAIFFLVLISLGSGVYIGQRDMLGDIFAQKNKKKYLVEIPVKLEKQNFLPKRKVLRDKRNSLSEKEYAKWVDIEIKENFGKKMMDLIVERMIIENDLSIPTWRVPRRKENQLLRRVCDEENPAEELKEGITLLKKIGVNGVLSANNYESFEKYVREGFKNGEIRINDKNLRRYFLKEYDYKKAFETE